MNRLSLIKRLNGKIAREQSMIREPLISSDVDLFLNRLDFQYVEDGSLIYEADGYSVGKKLRIIIYIDESNKVCVRGIHTLGWYEIYVHEAIVDTDKEITRDMIVGYINKVTSELYLLIEKGIQNTKENEKEI